MWRENQRRNAKYCSNCGEKLKFDKSVDASVHTAPKNITYQEFKKIKGAKSVVKVQVQQSVQESQSSLQSVTIQVGQVVAKDGDLRIKRGANLSLKVSQFINQDELKTRAAVKHSTFNNVIKNVPSAYKLLYPDKRLLDKLPGTDNGFRLKAYKEALGKPYSQITFFLTSETDYFDYIFSSDVLSSSDESVTELTTTWSYSCPTCITSTSFTSTSFTSTFSSDTSFFITNTTACAKYKWCQLRWEGSVWGKTSKVLDLRNSSPHPVWRLFLSQEGAIYR